MSLSDQQQPRARELFTPSSRYRVPCGTSTPTRNLIALGVLNGLIVDLSHVIFSAYVFFGPAGLVMMLFHQCSENLLIASVHLLLAIKAPRDFPFTSNAVIWGLMGLMMGWWPILPVAVPVALLVDRVVAHAVSAGRSGLLLLCFAVHATALSAANYWPYLLLKHSALIERMVVMDPQAARLVEAMTVPFFTLQLGATFITALLGGTIGLRLIGRHCQPLGWHG